MGKGRLVGAACLVTQLPPYWEPKAGLFMNYGEYTYSEIAKEMVSVVSASGRLNDARCRSLNRFDNWGMRRTLLVTSKPQKYMLVQK